MDHMYIPGDIKSESVRQREQFLYGVFFFNDGRMAIFRIFLCIK